MQTQDYLLLAAETGVIGLGSFFLTRMLKDGIARLKVEPWKRRWLVRLLALLFGAGLGALLPWPGWFLTPWGPVLGLIGGGFGPVLYDATKKALPAGLTRAMAGQSVTTTTDTLDETLPEAGEGLYIGDDGYKGGE